MTDPPPDLTADHIIAAGGWHPRWARVLAFATLGVQGCALVDRNGDGAELECEEWLYDEASARWVSGSSSGTGPLDLSEARLEGWGQSGRAYFAHGVAPGADAILVAVDNQTHRVAVTPLGVWLLMIERHYDEEIDGHPLPLPRPTWTVST